MRVVRAIKGYESLQGLDSVFISFQSFATHSCLFIDYLFHFSVWDCAVLAFVTSSSVIANT